MAPLGLLLLLLVVRLGLRLLLLWLLAAALLWRQHSRSRSQPQQQHKERMWALRAPLGAHAGLPLGRLGLLLAVVLGLVLLAQPKERPPASRQQLPPH